MKLVNKIWKHLIKVINNLIDFEGQRGEEVYDDLKRIYIDKDLGDFSPIQAFNGLQYSEAIFPKNLNTGLTRTRTRENYTVSTGSDNFDLRIGDSVAFWKDNINNRLRTKNIAINASNQPPYEGRLPNTEFNVEFGSGLPGNTSPSKTSKDISRQNVLGSYISGRSYQGSDGRG